MRALSNGLRVLRFGWDMFRTMLCHPAWFARETVSCMAQVRARSNARYTYGLEQIYHHRLHPDLPRLPVEVGGATWTDYGKAMIAARFCRLVEPDSILEIGTYRGGMSFHLVRNSPPGCRVWTLDLPRELLDAGIASSMIESDLTLASMARSEVGEQWRGTPEEARIIQIWGDSFDFDFTGLGPFGMIYVDGSHAGKWVAKDTENAFKLLASTGVILWDDCYWSDVLEVLGQYRRQYPIYLFEDGNTAGYLQIEGQPITVGGARR